MYTYNHGSHLRQHAPKLTHPHACESLMRSHGHNALVGTIHESPLLFNRQLQPGPSNGRHRNGDVDLPGGPFRKIRGRERLSSAGNGIDDQMLNVSGLLWSEIAELCPGDLIHRPAGGKEDTRSRDGAPTLR
ncbi:MAG: hypothetical protein KatS3mg112_0251 [Thermogutta sp.]|nr:MAG: hypothetical protein KatS3mg112_0251 [Thermogutta sp.]